MKLFIYPYKIGSRSAQALAVALDTKRIREQGTYRPKPTHFVINWGNPRMPRWGWRNGLNHPDAISKAADKLITYQTLVDAGVPSLEFTRDRGVAQGWCDNGDGVFARTLTRASGGAGITWVAPHGNLAEVAGIFFTKHRKHSGEYRLHVMRDKVIDFVKKKKMTEEHIQAQQYQFHEHIRNHDKGWVFAREDVVLPEGMVDVAVAAIRALGLDFGAVDMVWSKRNGPFVLEVNTAPGLEGTTLERYTAAFKEVVNDI